MNRVILTVLTSVLIGLGIVALGSKPLSAYLIKSCDVDVEEESPRCG